MTQQERRAMLDNEARKELDDIFKLVQGLKETKQEKIPLLALLGFVGWILGVTWVGAWKLSAINSAIETLQVTMVKAAQDRYTGRDADRDIRRLEQKNDFQDEQIKSLKDRMAEINRKVNDLHRKK